MDNLQQSASERVVLDCGVMPSRDLMKFCCSCDERYSTPFSYDEFTVFTDGHVAVRVPRLDDVTRETPTEAVRSMPFSPKSEDGGEWVFPDKLDIEYRKCFLCEGTCKVSRCGDCDGEGVVYWDVGAHEYEAECKECDAQGFSPGGDLVCPDCKGKGEVMADR